MVEESQGRRPRSRGNIKAIETAPEQDTIIHVSKYDGTNLNPLMQDAGCPGPVRSKRICRNISCKIILCEKDGGPKLHRPKARCFPHTSCKMHLVRYKMRDAYCGMQGASCKMQVTSCRMQGARCILQDARCRMHLARYNMHDASCKMRDACCKMQDAGCILQDARCILHLAS